MDFWATVLLIVLILGVSTIFWSLVGIGRFVRGRVRRTPPAEATVRPEEVAVLIAAHNEALVIRETIQAAARLVPLHNIHIISDASSDGTGAIARAAGVNELELHPNRGKAGALAEGIRTFQLCERYKVVLMLDADTRPTPDYLATGLPMFNDPEVVAVAGRAKSLVEPHPPTLFGRFLVAYRERLYVIVQLLMKYGQAASRANVVNIVPGFASMYRTDALRQIDVSGEGLVIEDFNMTFEVHAKKLGRIAFHPNAAIAYTQDPDNFRDYVRQIRRWNLGFWQTVRRHSFEFTKFWANLSVHIFELVSSALLLLLLVPAIVLTLIGDLLLGVTGPGSSALLWLSGLVPLQAALIGVFVPDFLLSIFAAVVTRRPAYLLFGLLFPFMRIVDAGVCMSQMPRAWSQSSGVWQSPSRRVQEQPQLT